MGYEERHNISFLYFACNKTGFHEEGNVRQ